MSTFHQRLGEQVKKIRERNGLTQEELAHRSRMSRSYVTQIEGGKRPRLSAEKVYNLALGLKCSMDELVGLPIRSGQYVTKRKQSGG